MFSRLVRFPARFFDTLARGVDGIKLLYMLIATLPQDGVALALIFSRVPFYEYYTHAPRLIASLDPLTDQTVAGAVLMIFFLTQAYRGGERTRERQTAHMPQIPSRVVPHQQAPVRTQMLAPVYRQQRKPRARMQQAARHKRAQQQDAERQPPEIVTDFIPVVYDPTPIERGRLVRIQLPRSAMVAFGLPMNEDRANEPVKADVLLDEQDEARAVRFVR